MTDPESGADLHDVAGLPRVLLAALEQTRSSTCITTADLDAPGPEIVYVNPAYCRMTGRRRADVIGRTPRLMQGPLTDRSVLDRLRTDLSAGRRFEGETVNYRADGTPFIINWSIDPVRDDDGTITHFVATQNDVTEQVRSARLLAAESALDDALTAALTSSLDLEHAMEQIVASVISGAGRIATVGSAFAQIDDLGRGHTVTAGRAADRGRAATVVSAPPASLTRVTIGISGMNAHEAAFLDRTGLTKFVHRAAGVAAALAEYGRQRDAALRLQRTLLPPADLSAPDWELVTEYVPGTFGLDVGGDWYDATADANRLVCSVGDVSGSGIEAAALMGRLRSLASIELERGIEVPELFGLLDRLCEQDRAMATMLVAEIEHATGTARLWSAGHLPPVVLAERPHVVTDLAVAPPLGHLRGATITPTPIDLSAGAGLVLFTDGLVERRGEDLTTSMERMVSTIVPDSTLTRIIDDLVGAHDHRHVDDLAVLGLRPKRRT